MNIPALGQVFLDLLKFLFVDLTTGVPLSCNVQGILAMITTTTIIAMITMVHAMHAAAMSPHAENQRKEQPYYKKPE